MEKKKIETFTNVPCSTECKKMLSILKASHFKPRFEELLWDMINVYMKTKNEGEKDV